jgi:hypothetical protein
MKTIFLILAFFLFGASLIVKSQTYKNQIGFQLNPSLDKNETFDGLVYGIRYGYKVSKPVTAGVEVSGTVPAFDNQQVKHYDYKIGIYSRCSLFTEKRVQGFLEISPFFSHRYIPAGESNIQTVENKSGLYTAPGVSIYSKNRKYSLDLYYKFFIHPGNSFYYQENTIAYKVNFHF